MCMGLLPSCMCLCITCFPDLMRAGGRCQCLGFELQMVVSHHISARNLDLLEEQSVPLTDQSSPDPIFVHFISVCPMNPKIVSWKLQIGLFAMSILTPSAGETGRICSGNSCIFTIWLLNGKRNDVDTAAEPACYVSIPAIMYLQLCRIHNLRK